MNKKFIIILLIILLIIQFNNLFAAQDSIADSETRIIPEKIENLEDLSKSQPLFTTRKDPFLAGFLSFFMMGAGQFYTGKYETGSLLLFSDIVLKSMFIGLILHLKAEYTTDINPTVYWRDISATDRTLIISFSVIYVVLLVVNINDAVQSAYEFNRKYIRERNIDIGINASKDNICFKLIKRF